MSGSTLPKGPVRPRSALLHLSSATPSTGASTVSTTSETTLSSATLSSTTSSSATPLSTTSVSTSTSTETVNRTDIESASHIGGVVAENAKARVRPLSALSLLNTVSPPLPPISSTPISSTSTLRASPPTPSSSTSSAAKSTASNTTTECHVPTPPLNPSPPSLLSPGSSGSSPTASGGGGGYTASLDSRSSLKAPVRPEKASSHFPSPPSAICVDAAPFVEAVRCDPRDVDNLHREGRLVNLGDVIRVCNHDTRAQYSAYNPDMPSSSASAGVEPIVCLSYFDRQRRNKEIVTDIKNGLYYDHILRVGFLVELSLKNTQVKQSLLHALPIILERLLDLVSISNPCLKIGIEIGFLGYREQYSERVPYELWPFVDVLANEHNLDKFIRAIDSINFDGPVNTPNLSNSSAYKTVGIEIDFLLERIEYSLRNLFDFPNIYEISTAEKKSYAMIHLAPTPVDSMSAQKSAVSRDALLDNVSDSAKLRGRTVLGSMAQSGIGYYFIPSDAAAHSSVLERFKSCVKNSKGSKEFHILKPTDDVVDEVAKGLRSLIEGHL